MADSKSKKAKDAESTEDKKKKSGTKKSAASAKKSKPKSKKSTAAKVTSSKKKATGKSTRAVAKKSSATPPAKTKGTKVKATSKKRTVKKQSKKAVDSYSKGINEDATVRGDSPMSPVAHLDEMRSRLLYSLGCIILFAIVGFFFSDYLMKFINQPFIETGQKLNIFKLTGGFMIRLKISIVVGLLLSVPVMVYHVWSFIKPAVAVDQRGFARGAIFAAIILFFVGVLFVFYGLLPFAIPMLLSFFPTDMLSTIGADDYMSFILVFSIAMGVLFELPIVVMILTKVGILTPVFLMRKRKHAIVIIWIIAALITPADILSQVLVAVPLMFLFEISIVISKIMIRRGRKKLSDSE